MSGEATGATLERLGRYELLGEIASGGMATVFLGRVTGAKGFARLVAIKRLHPHLESEEDFVAMFLDEARLAAKIRHQNVVGTLDVEDQAGLYIVMEYIEGDRLLGLLRHAARSSERIPVPVVIRIALDTLAGLHAAHELTDDDGEAFGLVHRDVSPQNILVGVDGVSRLTDFGIAKATSRLTVTRDGQLKGKIAYMAPEQTKRVEIDRRVDIFAMGIIVWEMFASKKLFQGESDVEVLNQLLFEPIPRLRESTSGIPAALDNAVMKALERDPTKRYATAAEFAESLERASKILGGPANARSVATHLQKVSADKLAKDRARVTPTNAEPPTPSRVQRRQTQDGLPAAGAAFSRTETTGPAVSARPPARPPAGTPSGNPPPLPMRRGTLEGLPVANLPPARTTLPGAAPPATPIATPAHAQNVVVPGPSLMDDDEDMPTTTHMRDGKILDLARPVPLTQQRNSDPPIDEPKTVAEFSPEEAATVFSTSVATAAPNLPPIVATPMMSVPAASAPPVRSIAPPPMDSATLDASLEPMDSGSSRRVWIFIAAAVALGGIAGTALWAFGGARAPSHSAHAAPAVRPVHPNAPPIEPVAAVAAPTPSPTPTNPPPVPTVAVDTPTAAAPPPQPATAPAAPPAAAPAPAPTPAPAPATVATSGESGGGGHSHSHHAHAGGSTSQPASTSTQSDNTTAPAPTPAPTPAPAHAHPHDEDPFGTDNPYQR